MHQNLWVRKLWSLAHSREMQTVHSAHLPVPSVPSHPYARGVRTSSAQPRSTPRCTPSDAQGGPDSTPFPALSVLLSEYGSCSLLWSERPAISGPVYTPGLWHSCGARGAAPHAGSPAHEARKECLHTPGHRRSSRRSWLAQMLHPVYPLMSLN